MPEDSHPPDPVTAGRDLLSPGAITSPADPGSNLAPAANVASARGAADTGPLRMPLTGPVISLPAEVDIANAGQVRADLLAAIDRGHQVVVADMSRTSFCDCAGVTALLAAGHYAARRGARLRVVARSRPVLRTFELTGLPLALGVYPASADALGDPGPAGTRRSSGGTPPLGTVTRLRTDAAGSGPRPDQPRCP